MQFILMLLLLQPPQIFTATGVYASPHVESPPVVVAAAPQPAGRRYLAMFTAQYCTPCQNWKRDVKGVIEQAGYTVVEYDMTVAANQQRYSSRIPRYPGFAVVDWDTGKWLSAPMIGSITADTAIAMLSKAATAVEAPVVQSVIQQPPMLPSVATPMLSPPVRYIEYPGWPEWIDLETYNRNCACPMCVEIRERQKAYWKDLKAYQAAIAVSAVPLPADKQGCPAETVEAMLDAMKLTPDDRLADWGCGDGRILIAAAKRGIPSIGVEIDPARAAVAVQAVKDAGVSDLVTIEIGDALDFDTTRATAVTAYLYPPLLAKLAPKLMQVRVAATPYHQVPGLDMTQVGDVWIYERPVAGEIISVTPDGGETTIKLQRTENPNRFSFTP